jgi:hypothetical protein
MTLLFNKYLVFFLFCMISPIGSNAEEKSTCIVDGIIETTILHDDGSVEYVYSTQQTQSKCDSLLANTESIRDTYMFGIETGQDMLRPVVRLKDAVLSKFIKFPSVKDKLVGQSIRVNIFSTHDGAVILRNISSRERLLEKISSQTIQDLIRMVESYKLAIYLNKQNRVEWGFVLYIRK